MAKEKIKKQTPLTLEGLAKYNQEILFPFMEGIFATKKDLEDLVAKKEFDEFKGKSLANEDAMLKKLDAILQENTMREFQDKKQKKLWAIIIKSLKEHNILSAKELSEITKLEFF